MVHVVLSARRANSCASTFPHFSRSPALRCLQTWGPHRDPRSVLLRPDSLQCTQCIWFRYFSSSSTHWPCAIQASLTKISTGLLSLTTHRAVTFASPRHTSKGLLAIPHCHHRNLRVRAAGMAAIPFLVVPLILHMVLIRLLQGCDPHSVTYLFVTSYSGSNQPLDVLSCFRRFQKHPGSSI